MDPLLVLVANSGDSTIGAFRLDGNRLTALGVSELPGACSTFAVDAARSLVYASVKAPEPAIVTLALDRALGSLTEIGRRRCGGAMVYLTLAAEGGLLLGASYHSGVGAVWPVADGVVGEHSAEIAFPQLHSVIAPRDSRHAYFASLGDDLIAQYELDAAGHLTPLDPPSVAAPAGSGPRHIVLSEDERSLYLLTEFSGEVIRFDRAADGRLTPAESVSIVDPDAGLKHSRFGADPRAEHLIWGADLHLAQGGRILLASERTASTIGSVTVDADGRLGQFVGVQQVPTQPRGFTVTPDGAHCIAAGERSTEVVVYSISAGGDLTPVGKSTGGNGANWVRVVS